MRSGLFAVMTAAPGEFLLRSIINVNHHIKCSREALKTRNAETSLIITYASREKIVIFAFYQRYENLRNLGVIFLDPLNET